MLAFLYYNRQTPLVHQNSAPAITAGAAAAWVNALLVGDPAGTAGRVAAELVAFAAGPVTLVSQDTAGLLAALDQPELASCDVLWADPAQPGSCDDAVVHRQMLHGAPEGVVVAVDTADDPAWSLGAQLWRRLIGVPLLVTGPSADGVRARLNDLGAELGREAREELQWQLVPGAGSAVLEHWIALLAAATDRPARVAAVPSGHACCAH
jgi:hypothetical protein